MAVSSCPVTGSRIVTFWVDGEPIPQGSVDAPAPGRVKHSRAELKAWREAVGWAFKAEHPGFEPWRGEDTALLLVGWFYLPRPLTVTRELPSTRPDLDKLLRAVGDALEGIAYEQDARITDIAGAKRYAWAPGQSGGTETPGARVTLTLSPGQGGVVTPGLLVASQQGRGDAR